MSLESLANSGAETTPGMVSGNLRGAGDNIAQNRVMDLLKSGAVIGGSKPSQTPEIPQGGSGLVAQSPQQQQMVQTQPSSYQTYNPITADQLLQALRSRSYG